MYYDLYVMDATAFIIGLFGMFALGLTHALGPDHLAAITVLAGPTPSAKQVLRTSLHFAGGHAALLVGCALASVLFGFFPSEGAMKIAETLGGVLLMALGGVMLHTTLQHQHEGIHGEPMPHTKNGRSGLLGAFLASSGARSFLLAISAAAAAHEARASLLFAFAFGLGVVVGMLGFGFILGWSRARLLTSSRTQYYAGLATALISVGLGFYWAVGEWI